MQRVRLVLTAPFFIFLTASAWAKIDTVKAVDFAFQPPTLTIKAGDTVVWKVTEECCLPHTTTRSSTPMTWNSGNLLLGGTFKVVFPDTGTFDYVCSNHSDLGMVGTIRVQYPKVPTLGWLGILLLLASLTATGIWLLQRRRQTA